MNPQPIASIAKRETGTIAGNATTEILADRPSSQSVLVHNCDTLYSLYITLGTLKDGTADHSPSSTNKDFEVLPGTTLLLDITEKVAMFARNSTGAATTVSYTASAVCR